MAGIEAWEKIFEAVEDEAFFAELHCSEPKYEDAGSEGFFPSEGEETPRFEHTGAYEFYEKLLRFEEEAGEGEERYGRKDLILRSFGGAAELLEERMVKIFDPMKEELFSEVYRAEEGGNYLDFYLKERERETLIKAFERSEEKSSKTRFHQRDSEEEEREAITKIASEKREALLKVRDEDHMKGGETKIEIIREKTRDQDIDMDSVTDLLTERIVDLMQRAPDGIYR